MRILLWMLFSILPFTVHAVEPRPAVKEALVEWVRALEAHDAARAVALYDKDSVMLSAFAIDPITTPEGLLKYYKKVVGQQNIHIVVTAENIREFGDVAVNTGLYRFHYEQEGEPMDYPARFSFVYVLKDGKWTIISHHSSIVPGKEKGE